MGLLGAINAVSAIPAQAASYAAKTAATLRVWPDGILGRAGGTNGKYFWYGSNGAVARNPHGQPTRVVGTLSNILPSAGVVNPAAVQNVPAAFDYCGGGPVVQIPGYDILLQVAHTEAAINKFFWSALSLLRSDDEGRSWNWLGLMITPSIRPLSTLGGDTEIAGGPIVPVGNWIYCFYREEVLPNYAGYAAVARVNATNFYRAALNNQVALWWKWGGTDWSVPGTGPSTGAQLPGLRLSDVPYIDWFDVVYLNGAGQGGQGVFLMVLNTLDYQHLLFFTSYDGINWFPQAVQGAVNPPSTNLAFYPSLAFDKTVARTSGGDTTIHLYYTQTLINDRLTGAFTRHYILTITPPPNNLSSPQPDRRVSGAITLP